MLVISNYRLAVLHYSYGCATLSAAYLCKVYVENHCGYTSVMGVKPYEQPVSINSIDRITALHFSYGRATLSVAYLGYPHVQNQSATQDIWASNGKCSLGWSVHLLKSLRYTSLMGIQR